VFDYTAGNDQMQTARDCFGTYRMPASDMFDEHLDPTGISAREVTTEADRMIADIDRTLALGRLARNKN
jgi:hypothetical protein